MTEEQQRAYEVAQDVIEAASNLSDAICRLFDEVVEVVKKVIESIIERCQSVYKQIKRYNCNNWRRVHGLPLIHRNKKCRQGKTIQLLI